MDQESVITMAQKRKRSTFISQKYDFHRSSTPTSSIMAERHHRSISVGEVNEMPERKRLKDSFDNRHQVEDQATFTATERPIKTPSAHRSASIDQVDLKDEGEPKGTFFFKGKGSSHSTNEDNLSDNVDKKDEEQKRKKRRTESAGEGTSRSPGQIEAQQVQRCTEEVDRLQKISSAVEDHGVQGPPENQPNIFSRYKIVQKIGNGAFGTVFKGKRLSDDLKVAIKITKKGKDNQCIIIPGHPAPLPLEVGLLILANKDYKVPQIIELLDWEEQPDRYILILEHPAPCEDLWEYLHNNKGTIGENMVRTVMVQVIYAAYMCCKRGVFHRDIKPENLLINTESLEVKLIDFGCGDLLKESGYSTMRGTLEYFPPEYFKNGQYHARPATVWSLGVMLFEMVCGRFPNPDDLLEITSGNWFRPGWSYCCCHLICCLLQKDPRRRIELNYILFHPWFKPEVPDQEWPRNGYRATRLENDYVQSHSVGQRI